jgi:hypothetical protein
VSKQKLPDRQPCRAIHHVVALGIGMVHESSRRLRMIGYFCEAEKVAWNFGIAAVG